MRELYQWMQLTTDGLLVLPEDVGSHYDPINVNVSRSGEFGFKTKEEAMTALKKFCGNHDVIGFSDYTLISLFSF